VRDTPHGRAARAESARTRVLLRALRRKDGRVSVETAVAVPLMTEAEARVKLKLALDGIDDGFALLLEVHAREGWRALGYPSMAACLQAEYGKGRTQAFDVTTALRISTALSVWADTTVLVPPKHARELRRLPDEASIVEVHAEVVERTGGAPTTAAYRAAVEQRLAPESAVGSPQLAVPSASRGSGAEGAVVDEDEDTGSIADISVSMAELIEAEQLADEQDGLSIELPPGASTQWPDPADAPLAEPRARTPKRESFTPIIPSIPSLPTAERGLPTRRRVGTSSDGLAIITIEVSVEEFARTIDNCFDPAQKRELVVLVTQDLLASERRAALAAGADA
jgi:hypothetical protein